MTFHHQKKTLALAISTILTGLVVVPALSDDIYEVDGNGSEQTTWVNNGIAEEVAVIGAMESITNNLLIQDGSEALTVEGPLGSLSSLENNGVIQAATSDSVARAVVYETDLIGVINNSGRIIAHAFSDDDIFAAGIFIEGSVASTAEINIANTGEIIASATAGSSYDATALGILITGDVAGSITNNGNISVEAVDASFGSSAIGVGIAIQGALSGSIVNNGQISLDVQGQYAEQDGAAVSVGSISEDGSVVNDGSIVITLKTEHADVSGIYVDNTSDSMAGEIINNQRIEISNQFLGDDQTYYGINVRPDVVGSVTNNGEIVLTALASDSVELEGIHVGSVSQTGTVTNNGSIELTALNSDDEIAVTGIHVNGDMEGMVSNTGEINIIATQFNETSDGIEAGGIWVDGELIGTVSNSGDISVVATAAYGSDVSAYGIFVSGDMSGKVINTNTGTIDVKATYSASSLSGSAIGLYLEDDVSGTVTNDGQIIAAAVFNDDNSVYVAGMYYDEDITGDASVTNSGSITAILTAEQAATYGGSGYGIHIDGDLVGDLTNTGSIDVSAEGNGWEVYRAAVNGIYIGGDVSGSIDNQADIRISGDGSYSSVSGSAIYAGEVSGTITNSGTIMIDFGDSSNSDAYIEGGVAIEVDRLAGSITNSGMISVVAKAAGEGDLAGISAERIGTVGDGDATPNVGIANHGTIEILSNGQNAMGIRAGSAGGVAVANVVNAGTINVTGSSGLQSGIVSLSFGGTAVHEVTNEGEINVTVVGDSSALGAGMQVFHMTEGGSTTVVTNSGSIDVTVAGEISSLAGPGIAIDGLSVRSVGGSILNSGSITVDAVSGGQGAVALKGVAFSDFGDGQLTNTGHIEVKGGDGAFGTAVLLKFENGDGVFENGDGVFDNQGTVSVSRPALGSASGPSLLAVMGNGDGIVTNSGTIEGTVLLDGLDLTNSGTVSLSSDDTIAIDGGGNYLQTSDGILEMHAAGDSQYSRIQISGVASFENGTNIKLTIADDAGLEGGDTLTEVVSATTLESSTFSITDNEVGLSFAAVDAGDDTLDIVATAHDFTNLVEATRIAGRSAAEGAASAMDSLIANDSSGDQAFFFGSMNDSSQMANIVESLVPSLSGGVAQLTSLEGNSITDAVASRQSALNGISTDSNVSQRNVWIKAISGTLEVDDSNSLAGYESDRDGFAFGIDRKVSPNWTLGAAVADSTSEAMSRLSAGAHNLNMDSIHFKLYATAELDNAGLLNIQLGRGAVDYESVRTIHSGQSARADYSGDYTSAAVELSYAMEPSKKTLVMPYVSLDYGKVNVDAYTETGAGGMNLNVESQRYDSLIFGLGLKAQHAISDSVVLSWDTGVGFDKRSDAPETIARFTEGGPSFTTYGHDLDRVVKNAGLAANVKVFDSGQLSLRYDYTARSGVSDGAVSLSLKLPL